MRLLVARCEVRYTGRLTAMLPESTRLLIFKSDGSVLVHADAGGYKPLNWMTPPTTVEESDGLIVVRKRAGRAEDCLEIRLAEVLSDVSHEMGEAAGLEKDGVERDLQEVLADRPEALGEELRLVRREWPTDIGPGRPDVPRPRRRLGGGRGEADRRDRGGRAARPLLGADPARSRRADCRGVLAATRFRPQALTLADSRGVRCAEVDLAVLRGEREPELTLFS